MRLEEIGTKSIKKNQNLSKEIKRDKLTSVLKKNGNSAKFVKYFVKMGKIWYLLNALQYKFFKVPYLETFQLILRL